MFICVDYQRRVRQLFQALHRRGPFSTSTAVAAQVGTDHQVVDTLRIANINSVLPQPTVAIAELLGLDLDAGRDALAATGQVDLGEVCQQQLWSRDRADALPLVDLHGVAAAVCRVVVLDRNAQCHRAGAGDIAARKRRGAALHLQCYTSTRGKQQQEAVNDIDNVFRRRIQQIW